MQIVCIVPAASSHSSLRSRSSAITSPVHGDATEWDAGAGENPRAVVA